jgi:hypothetical protein
MIRKKGGGIMKKNIISVAIALVVGSLFTLGVATPASAAYYDCPNGWFCAWSEPNGTAVRYQYPWSAYPGNCVNLPADTRYSTDNDNFESYANFLGSGKDVLVWSNSNCTGNTDILYDCAEEPIHCTKNVWWVLTDAISSFKFVN